jgi:phosphodiesterase/alkaline phosphatase D-like protein
MKRREFIVGLAGAAALSVYSPISASAQQSGRPKRIAILMGVKAGDFRRHRALCHAGCRIE